MDDADVIDAAKLIRPYLVALVGPDRAAELDSTIGTILAARSDVQDAGEQLRELLTRDHTLLQWVEDALDDPQHLPPELQLVRSGDYQQMPGGGDVVPADLYVCPVGNDTNWYRPKIGTAVITCSTHQVLLVRAERTTQ